jgi:hypothetical protein
MSIDIGCINSTSALRRPLPIADALPYAARACLLGLCIITELRLGALLSRIGAMSSANSAADRRHRAHLRPIQSP